LPDRPVVVTIIEEAYPNPLILTSVRQTQVDLHLLLPSWPTHPWCPAVAPDAVHRPPPRRHRHCRPAVGNHRPSAPTPMPLTGTAASGTGPAAGPGAWSRAAAVGPEYGAGHSFLWPPPAVALGPRLASRSPLAPTVTARRRPRPGATAAAAWPAVGDRCPRPSARRRGPGYTSPSSGPRRQMRGWDSGTPLVKMSGPEIFSKNHSRKNTPRVMGPEPKNFKPIFDRGITHLGRLTDTP
jgi:hypothetical protein